MEDETITKPRRQNRDAAYRRQKREDVIRRKEKIIHEQNDYWHYGDPGRLSKGKIHCSCPLCRRKSYDSARRDDAVRAQSMLSEAADEGFGVNRLCNRLKTLHFNGVKFRSGNELPLEV